VVEGGSGLDAAQGFAARRKSEAEERTQGPDESQREKGECCVAGEVGKDAQEPGQDGHGEERQDHDEGIGSSPQALPDEGEPGAPDGSREFRTHA
jgi:hypothetical protein